MEVLKDMYDGKESVVPPSEGPAKYLLVAVYG